ncbi:MAG: hypothetical protein GTO45_38720 [Candidatus Aminicenantes bacterium]|jgi:hypothetical protein|nr:hypothetical protein [Candidatus Aminicenantes bacterium]NIM84559.1 hypothetical protein [Candidatus Aminicenantes bacterium]NIN24079.1 hypothetical protein [Candidatus Aminicenantes bacterium]NIN47785.1 hypothetical protein [Candidatus Aminicenantes bacterium]NIN90723.1 hypothetical protein [Candidatus Aminicenantes bacterium]
MSTRKEPRTKKTFRVKVVEGDNAYPGIVTNCSKSGMSIKTDHVFPTFKVVDVLVKIGQKLVPIKGSVRWVHEGVEPENPDEDQYKNEIGVAFQNPPPEYLKRFE